MSRSVKKGIILVFSCICLIGLTGCHWFSSEKQKTQLTTTEATIEAVKETKGTLQSTESNSQIGSLEDETAQQIDEITKNFLKDFARKWSNFTDVYKRN
ncbi:EF0163 family protein [Enterococcus avium]|uniref:EF0163 family protein n=1 Tax=Enterococcus TaxID=1350 RepID=UPI001CED3258|nr:EF0163 family protein [Enterococcus avium]